jgi:ribonuclease VapC
MSRLAMLFGEPEATPMVKALEETRERYVSAPTLTEAGMVEFARLGAEGELALDALLQRLSIRSVAMTPAAASAALAAYRRYGKGVRAPAVLDFGDCLCLFSNHQRIRRRGERQLTIEHRQLFLHGNRQAERPEELLWDLHKKASANQIQHFGFDVPFRCGDVAERAFAFEQTLERTQ